MSSAGRLALWAMLAMLACRSDPPPRDDAGTADGAVDSLDAGSDGEATDAAVGPDVDEWRPMTVEGAPSPRAWHVALWTGTEMIVWGGHDDSGSMQTGGRYDPDTDTWSATSLEGAPSPRYFCVGVWTGSEMIIWGGLGPGDDFPMGNALADGARYDPVNDRWTRMSDEGAPTPRREAVAVWTGSELLVWGGGVSWKTEGGPTLGDGARYDPATDQWAPLATEGAPEARRGAIALWTGSEMLVWGGLAEYEGFLQLRDGGRYDPATDSWQPIPPVHLKAIYRGLAVWTGTSLLAFTEDIFEIEGYSFDLATAEWSPIATSEDPTVGGELTAVWTDDRLILWGGIRGTDGVDEGMWYSPTDDAWGPISSAGAAEPRQMASGVWTGREVLIWGGYGRIPFMPIDTGGSYTP